jgi:hypothetical protein
MEQPVVRRKKSMNAKFYADQFRPQPMRIADERQVPKLPAYAVIDTTVRTSSRAPGGVVCAEFFNEDCVVRVR